MQSLESAFRSGLDTTRHWLIEAIRLLPHLVVALLVLLLSIWLGRVLRRRLRKPLERSFRRSHSGTAMVTLVGQSIFILCVVLGILIDASILGLDKVFASVIASAGVFGLAIGYAFKDIAANFFAGVVISLRQPMKTADLVEIGGQRGRVVEIDLLYTTIQTLDGQIVYIPNQTAYSNPIVNYTQSGVRRIVLQTGVSYGDDLEDVRTLALSTIKGFDFLMPEKPVDLYFNEIGGSSYNFSCATGFATKARRNTMRLSVKASCTSRRPSTPRGFPFPTRYRHSTLASKVASTSSISRSPLSKIVTDNRLHEASRRLRTSLRNSDSTDRAT